jgi:hypothetical protein
MARNLSGDVAISSWRLGQQGSRERAAAKPSSSGGEEPRPHDLFVQLTATRGHLRFVFVKRNVLSSIIQSSHTQYLKSGGIREQGKLERRPAGTVARG